MHMLHVRFLAALADPSASAGNKPVDKKENTSASAES